jgi:excisionase family DNA binding protein
MSIWPRSKPPSGVATNPKSQLQADDGSKKTWSPDNGIHEFKSRWLTHAEAASYLGVAVSTLYHYAEQERIECRKIGNRLEYRRSSLDRFKESLIRPARRSRNRGTIAPMLLGSGN